LLLLIVVVTLLLIVLCVNFDFLDKLAALAVDAVLKVLTDPNTDTNVDLNDIKLVKVSECVCV
jgi:hypothetical protein